MHSEWQPFPIAFFFLDYGKPDKASENYFSATFLQAADMKAVRHATGAESMTRACNMLIEKTQDSRQEVIAIVVNEAQRFSEAEYDHLVTMDNMLERRKKRVFFILIHQNDADIGGKQSIDRRPPSHVTGRFYSMAHKFTGLQWGKEGSIDFDDCDVAMALNEYDDGPKFPDEATGVPPSAYFAHHAYASGYRLTSQVGLFRESVKELRIKNHLDANAPFPMQSFERFVYFLLVRTAWDDPNFREFSKPQVDQALLWSGYIELELSNYRRCPMFRTADMKGPLFVGADFSSLPGISAFGAFARVARLNHINSKGYFSAFGLRGCRQNNQPTSLVARIRPSTSQTHAVEAQEERS